MRYLLASAILSLTFSTCAIAQSGPIAEATASASSENQFQPATLASLVDEVDIPYETFTLENGLTTIVHTDRKTPVVGVTVYYRVGSKSEPRGKTGFAHLFEHLMFGGSANVPNFDIPLEAAGSTSTNGSTWYDRTNYVETVPTGALDLALFMESDRMGHLLPAVTQDKLDKQRGVVQNEKRQGDNQPYGLADYAIGEGLLPVGHPYRHSTIGSMADLDAASLADVRKWFIDNYGPNNVVIALAGDIDAATAKKKIEHWFGDIPRGPDIAKVSAEPVTLAAPVSREMTDQVPVTRIYRAWSGPALTSPDSVPLAIGMHVLGGLASSRLDNVLVRDEQLAVSVAAYAQQHEQLSFLEIQMDVKPGIDRAVAEKRLDEVVRQFVKQGPTQDELNRAATEMVSQQIGALEVVGGFSGKGATLAEGLLYADNPALYKDQLDQMASLTPAQVTAVMQRWLSRPVYRLAVIPGERSESGAAMGGWGDEDTAQQISPQTRGADSDTTGPEAAKLAAETEAQAAEPRTAPELSQTRDLTFPDIQHATLSNGMAISLAHRDAIPKVLIAMEFDAGYAADGSAGAGKQSLMMDMLEEGTTHRDAIAIAEEQERLGATISTGTSLDTSSVMLSALTANLAPSLDLMADVIRNPAFTQEDVARVKGQRLADIAQAEASPFGIARRAIEPILYGPQHPYGSVGALGTTAVVEPLTPADLRSEHSRWLRPDLARITVVGDITMEQLIPQLERVFGDWQAPAAPAPGKDLTTPTPKGSARIVVIDRPNSPQSALMFGKVLPLTGQDAGQEPLDLANEVIGNGFLSRLNTDLREDKGWTYGIRTSLSDVKGPRSFEVMTPVQADRTADSIKLILADMKAFPTARPVDDVELQRVTQGNIRGLPNRFQTNAQVLSGIIANQHLGRPDDYYADLADIYRAIDGKDIDEAAASYLQPDNMVIVVVGDRKVVEPQLADIGLPVEYIDSAGE
ncbi:insulinase family protein [Altericroceibacterium spongiae]|uniref:Insulinase family protein n=1 Tax=Altericroceibacterium spongiae TaxID=2320269 RepID=A0A420EK56_9SPHN|nr:pitrilysin family protein [Altericroceibacterium spongiae]RKF21111.1 insulinase family protein [Altericroceibacterium spongiae]